MERDPKLIVLSEQLRGQSFELNAMQYEVGRSEECSICIPDPTMSSRHCRLERNDDGSYTIRDNGSTNGTRVNGVRIEEQKLNNSDIVQVGGVEVLYDSGERGMTSIASSQTKINLSESSGNLSLNEMTSHSPFGSKAETTVESGSRLTWLIYAGIGILAAVIAVLLFQLIRGIATP